jgi:hypothetical protein
LPRQPLNLQCCCLSLLNAGIVGMHHHSWFVSPFLKVPHVLSISALCRQ